MCVLLALLASCGGNQAQQELSQINIACFPNITHAQALLLKGQGTLEPLFEEDGIAINWITFNAGPSQIEALFAGATNGGSVLVARNDSDIRSTRDLDGMTVAIPQFGNTQHLSLLKLLTANGFKPSTHGGTVNVVQSSNADIANLMDMGSIDAALVPEPWGSILDIRSDGRVVLDYFEIDPDGIPATAVVIVRKDFLVAYPEIVKKFIGAHMEATAFINDNLEFSMRVINEQIAEITHVPISEDVLSSAFSRLHISYEIPLSSIMDFARTGAQENLFPGLPDSGLTNDMYIRD